MSDPATIGAIAIGGIAWVLSAIGRGATDRAFRELTRGVKDRVAGLRDRPENHDVARAVRTAQIQALERVIREYRDSPRPEWETDPSERPDIFLERSLDFANATLTK